MSVHLPDEAVVIGDAVQPLGEAGGVRRRDYVVDLPSLRIDTEQRLKAIRVDPDFAVVRLPRHAMRGAAIVFGAEWNLPVADLLAIHISLEDPINRRSRVIDHRGAIGSAPDITTAEAHTAAVLAVGHNGVKKLALPVDEPGGLRFVVVTLLLDPETS